MIREVIAAFILTLSIAASVKNESPLKCYQCNNLVNETCEDPFDEVEDIQFLKECDRKKIAHQDVPLKYLQSFINCNANETIKACKMKASSSTPHWIIFPQLKNCFDNETLEKCDSKTTSLVSFEVSYPAILCRKSTSTIIHDLDSSDSK